MLESRLMFEIKLRTYWKDTDPAGIVYYSNYFNFVEQAEEEMFRAHGANRQDLLQQHKIWMPRVECFFKFVRPIRIGTMIRVRLNHQFKGTKTIRYEIEIVEDASGEKLAEGYTVVVCVDAARFKAVPIPNPVRIAIDGK